MMVMTKIIKMFHLGEEVSTVARSVAVFPVEVADRAAIGRLQDNNDNHYEYIDVHTPNIELTKHCHN